MHCIPDPRMHGLNGYYEVIQTIEWGLQSLGHSVSYGVNTFNADDINIVFGAQVLPISTLEKLPKNTIIYNFEQLRALKKNEIRDEITFFADKFRIWDFSDANLETWKLLNASKVSIVPVSYAPILSKIKSNAQDIDILMYGLPGPKRLDAFSFAASLGLKVIYASGFYGAERDDLISRSKIILNVNLYDFAKIFEVVRVSYLLANKKAVVSILEANTYIEPGYEQAVKFVEPRNFEKTIETLLSNEAERHRLENAGFDFFSQKDIKVSLAAAIQDLSAHPG
jgi:hypothetical protein